jgi:hypothetical protein
MSLAAHSPKLPIGLISHYCGGTGSPKRGGGDYSGRSDEAWMSMSPKAMLRAYQTTVGDADEAQTVGWLSSPLESAGRKVGSVDCMSHGKPTPPQHQGWSLPALR